MQINSNLENRGCLFGMLRGVSLTFGRFVWIVGTAIFSLIVANILYAVGENKGSKAIEWCGSIVILGGAAIIVRWVWLWWLRPIVKGGAALVKSTGLVKDNTFKDKPYAMSWRTAQGRYINVGNPFRGIFVMGGAGSGKSESVAVPALQMFAKMNFSGIVYDFKFPTLAQDVETFYEANRSPVRRFFIDLEQSSHSYRVNPLAPKYVRNSSYANEFAQAIIDNLIPNQSDKSDFWTSSATALLTACIWFLRKNKPEWCDLPHVCAMVTSSDENLLRLLHTDTETANLTISVFNAMKRKADAQVAGVVSTLQNAIAKINTPRLMWVFGADEVNLDINNPDNPVVLTIGSNPTLVKTFAPLVSLVATVCIKQMNAQGKAPSFVMLDEAPTIKIPNFSMLPATGRSNKIVTMYMCQDYSQMVNQYGQQAADEIFANLNNHFYGRVSSGKTAKLLSQQFGRIDESYVTSSMQNTSILKQNLSESLRERDMIRSNEFTSLQVGEFAGLAVETNTPIWRAQLARVNRPTAAPIPYPIRHTESEIEEYYAQVRQDIDSMLGDAPTPNGRSSASPERAGRKDQGREQADYIFE